jgi:hypothetical protein
MRKLFPAIAAVVCLTVVALILTATVFAQEPDQIVDTAGLNVKHQNVPPRDHTNGQAHARFGINGIDSLVNFNDHYFTQGFNNDGLPQREWFTNTVGNPPNMHGTTTINAPIVPVEVHLLNADGTQRFVNGQPLITGPAAQIQTVLDSPVFSFASFDSSPIPTQVTDAVQRAEYFAKAKSDWHTLLAPAVKTTRTISFLRGTYAFALNPDGTCCRFVLVDANTFVNALFPATDTDTTTPIGAAEHAGDMTTADISTMLFKDIYLFVGNTNNCCILGFHTYDVEPGTAANGNRERRFVVNYSSWISPGLFGGGFQDVTALSHEIAELYNDPFVVSDGVHNLTPWWLAPNGNCQNDLETGDVIEGLPRGVFPVTMPNGFTYHPQNEALLQWFQFKSPSDAIHGSYSYPDPLTLTTLSPAGLGVNCK